MFLYKVVLVSAVISSLVPTVKLQLSNANEIDPRNRKDLIEIIKSLNAEKDNGNEDDNDDSEVSNKISNKDTNSEDINDEEKERKLQDILGLLKKNYDTQKRLNFMSNPYSSAARLYLIRNPGVLKEYKNYLERKKRQSSSSENYSRENEGLKERIRKLRRNAVFRLNSPEDSDVNMNRMESFESSQVQKEYVKPHLRELVPKRQMKEPFVEKRDEKQKRKPIPYDDRPLPVDSMEIHNKKVHNDDKKGSYKIDWDERHNKYDEPKRYDMRDEKFDNEPLKLTNKKISNKKPLGLSQDKFEAIKKISKKDTFNGSGETFNKNKKLKDSREFKMKKVKPKPSIYDWDQKTTEWTNKQFKKKKVVFDEPRYRPKPKKGLNRSPIHVGRVRDDFYSFGRTSIPFVVLISCLQCKKYNIEEEAQKYYGESFRSVLEKFRQTQDYLRILKTRVDQILKTFAVGQNEVTHHYRAELLRAVAKELKENSSNPHYFRFGRPTKRPKTLRKLPKVAIRNRAKSARHLDKYAAFQYPLTLTERNRMKDLGFEYAGRAIHDMILYMSPDDASAPSTRQPYVVDDKTASTTPHSHDHEVTWEHDTVTEWYDPLRSTTFMKRASIFNSRKP